MRKKRKPSRKQRAQSLKRKSNQTRPDHVIASEPISGWFKVLLVQIPRVLSEGRSRAVASTRSHNVRAQGRKREKA